MLYTKIFCRPALPSGGRTFLPSALLSSIPSHRSARFLQDLWASGSVHRWLLSFRGDVHQQGDNFCMPTFASPVRGKLPTSFTKTWRPQVYDFIVGSAHEPQFLRRRCFPCQQPSAAGWTVARLCIHVASHVTQVGDWWCVVPSSLCFHL